MFLTAGVVTRRLRSFQRSHRMSRRTILVESTEGPTLRLALMFTVAVVSYAAPHQILFNRIGPYEAGIFVANADGTGERPLLKSMSLDYNPSWSRDGQWIVFTSERDGSAELYRAKPNGTNLERLTSDPAYDDQAAFSPDGQQIVFVSTRASGTAHLWVMDVRTRKIRS